MPKVTVTVTVTLKPSLLDAQGRTVESALHSMGYEEVNNLRIGRIIEMDISGEASREEIEARATAMCDRLLANPVTESYKVEITE